MHANTLPEQPHSQLRAQVQGNWQITAALLIFVASLAALFWYRSATVLIFSTTWLLTASAIGAHLYTQQRGHPHSANTIGWVSNLISGFVFVLISHSLLPISLLAMIDGALYTLSPSQANRSTVRIDCLLTGLGIVLIVLFAETTHTYWQPIERYFLEADKIELHLLTHSGAISPPIITAIMLVLFISFFSTSILNHLWNYYRHIGNTIKNLEHANMQVRAAQAELQQRLHEHAQMLAVSRSVSSTMELTPLLTNILIQLHTVIAFGRATIMLLRQGELVELCTYGTLDRYQDRLGQFVADPQYLQSMTALREAALFSDLGQLVPDLSGTLIAVPLIVRGQFIGILTIRHEVSRFYTQHDASLGMAFANQVAGVIDAAQLQTTAAEAGVLAERSRLAHELHESVSQSLYGIVLGTRTALEQIDNAPEAARAALCYSVDLAHNTLAEMRTLIFSMRPTSAD